jgi:hypothetical protein
MMAQAAAWLFDRIDLVLLIPVAAVACCVLLHRAGIIRSSLNDMIYLTAALSSVIGYGFAFSPRVQPLVAIFLTAPQTYILLGMFLFVGARKLLSTTYRAPSPWWVVLVAILGHGWTRLWFYALGDAA